MTAKELSDILLQHPDAKVCLTVDPHLPKGKHLAFQEKVEQGETACLILIY